MCSPIHTICARVNEQASSVDKYAKISYSRFVSFSLSLSFVLPLAKAIQTVTTTNTVALAPAQCTRPFS